MKSTPSLASRMLLVCRLNRHLSIGYVCPCRIDFMPQYTYMLKSSGRDWVVTGVSRGASRHTSSRANSLLDGWPARLIRRRPA